MHSLPYWQLILFILLFFNTAGLVIVALDKQKARKKRWRIPEKTFFLLSAAGGSVGVYAGLLLFRHKTRHWYFMLGIPLILAFQLFLAYFLLSGKLSNLIINS